MGNLWVTTIEGVETVGTPEGGSRAVAEIAIGKGDRGHRQLPLDKRRAGS
jgi:hypothetical protein